MSSPTGQSGRSTGQASYADGASALSDGLVRQLMAVGQADILVGLPTLDNAATVEDIVRAIHVSFTRDFPRLRTVMLNSDGGSTDGTPERIRDATFAASDRVLTSHPLRTLHRVVAPYHGQPGKLPALRTIFAAADLTQARVVVVLDPAGAATTAERVTELVTPVLVASAEFLAPRYQRHPRDGLLVTQLVRPLVRAVYGVALDEPLGVEFAASGRFVSHCLDGRIWDEDVGRFAIDLWLRTEAAANGFPIAQIWRPMAPVTGPRARLREAVQQVLRALVESLRAHEHYWLADGAIRALPTIGSDSHAAPAAPAWDFDALAQQARRDIEEIQPLLANLIDAGLQARLSADLAVTGRTADDELWVRLVYAFAAAARQGRTNPDHLAAMFAPLYLWRAAAFMAMTAHESDHEVQARLETLSDTFERLRPALVDAWTAAA